jgi:phosphocarrier protein
MEIELKVNNNMGIHARVAARIAEVVREYGCEVTLSKDEINAAGDSILEILTLGAPQGTMIKACAAGPREQEVLAALQKLFAADFGGF